MNVRQMGKNNTNTAESTNSGIFANENGLIRAAEDHERGQRKMKTLTLVTAGLTVSNQADEEADLCPRGSLYNRELNTDLLDERAMLLVPRWRRIFYKVLPFTISQVIEAYLNRHKYDVVISWYDAHALLLAFLLKLTRDRIPHIALMSWISKPKKAFLLKRVHEYITTIVLWTSSHRDFAINKLGIPPDKVRWIPYGVDQKFYRPMPRETDMICSAGKEMRDYITLVEAMRGLDIKCHIAVSLRGKLYPSVKALYEMKSIPANVTIGNLSPVQLRDLYARSRFVVVPLLKTDSDNGLTVILEAMAMGKAVICSRVDGQRDVIVEGKTGIFVPQGDPIALREAIKYLWANPSIAEQMGREGRKRIEEMFTLDQFVHTVKEIAEEAMLAEETLRRERLGAQ
jgi:glycosyltransferase involved in cell wall biosynthesis